MARHSKEATHRAQRRSCPESDQSTQDVEVPSHRTRNSRCSTKYICKNFVTPLGSDRNRILCRYEASWGACVTAGRVSVPNWADPVRYRNDTSCYVPSLGGPAFDRRGPRLVHGVRGAGQPRRLVVVNKALCIALEAASCEGLLASR